RVTLNNGTVLNVEPLVPRPLPPYDQKKAKAQALKRKQEKGKPPEEGNIALPGKESKFRPADATDEDDDPLAKLTIHLLEGELHARQPDYPGLADELATAYGARINSAFEVGAYARGRQILHDLEGLAPDHDQTKQARERFIARARGLAEKAGKASGADRLDLL